MPHPGCAGSVSLAAGGELKGFGSCRAALAAGSSCPKGSGSNEAAAGYVFDSDPEVLLHKLPPTPVPKLQLASLCLARLADPITFTQIFPYVNEMIQDLGVADIPSEVGFYSGIVVRSSIFLLNLYACRVTESAFAISQLLAIFPCARLSDIIGRRPVILVGVAGLAFATFAFGLSKTFMAILVTRCLAGALAGNVATIHAALAEITDASNQAIAFPAYGLSWPIGSIIGPLIGGTFSNPAKHFIALKSIPLLNTYPYLLPCVISGVIALCGALLGYLCLEETLPDKRRDLLDVSPPGWTDTTKAYGTVNHVNAHQVTFTSDTSMSDMHPVVLSSDPNPGVGMIGLLAIPIIRKLAISSLALSFLSGAFDVVFVLFCYSPIATGGLGYSATHIGYALAIAGTSAALFQALVLPTLLRRIPAATVYKTCMKLWPFAYLILPLLNLLAQAGLEANSRSEIEVLKPTYAVAVWIGISACLAVTRLANLAFSLSMILVKDTSPSPSALGAANGLAQFSMCMARAVAPAFVSALFAVSVNNRILGSYLWVFVMVLFAWAGIRVTDRIDFPGGVEQTNISKTT